MFEQHCLRMVPHLTIVLILAFLSLETLASPLKLEVSINGVQNGNTVEVGGLQSLEGACAKKHKICEPLPNSCCKGLHCKPEPHGLFILTCQ